MALVLSGTLVNSYETKGPNGVSRGVQVLSNGGPKMKLMNVKDAIPGDHPIKWDNFVGREISLEVDANVFDGNLYWSARKILDTRPGNGLKESVPEGAGKGGVKV